MDFLNQSFAQLKDLFDGMTPGSRITAGLLLVVVVVSLGYLFTYSVPGGDVYLLEGRMFTGPEIQAIEAALGVARLPCETDGGRIRVPRGKKYEYMGALAKADALPKDFGQDLQSMLQNSSAFGSWKLTKEQIKIGTERQLSQIIGGMPGVKQAAVQYNREEKKGWMKDDVVNATANVWMVGSKEVDKDLVDSICTTIMGPVPGVSPENIRVVDITNNRSFQGNAEDLAGGSGGSYATRTREWEEYYRDNILALLQDVRGVSVRCSVALSKEKSVVKDSVDHDTKTVTRAMEEETSTRSFQGAEPAGRPGPVGNANTPRALGNSQGKGSTEDADESKIKQDSVPIQSTQTRTELAGLIPEQVKVSINVPRTHIEDIWHQKNDKPGEEPKDPEDSDLAPLERAELANIKSIAAGAIPDVQGVDDLTDLVHVRFFTTVAAEPIPEPGMTENAFTWLGQSWQTLGLIGLAFFSLLMIRSMVKSSPSVGVAETPAGRAVSGPQSEEGDESSKDTDSPRLVRFGTSGKSLKDELADLVSEDPDAAASVLKNWIGHVSNAA